MSIFDRSHEISIIFNSFHNGKIKIVTGIRRCGKTYMLTKILPNALKRDRYIKSLNAVLIIELKGKDSNIRTKNQFNKLLTSQVNLKYKYIVIDEVQKINGYYDILIEFIQKYPSKEVFVTGSNSKILSHDILVNFQEYGYDIHLNPLSYKEIKEVIPNYSMDDYLKYGGLPFVVNQTTSKAKEAELNRIYNELYESDIKDKINNNFTYISKNKVRKVLRVIFSTTSEISIKGIASHISSGNDSKMFDALKLNAEVENLIQILIDSYLIQEFENDSFNSLDVLKYLGLNKKYYCTDNGLLYINCDDEERIDGIVFENAIFLHLINQKLFPRGKIILGKKNKRDGEIDFNYIFNKEEYHIQVTYKLMDSNFYTEVGNLLSFNDNSKKILVYRIDESTIKKSKDVQYIDCESYLLK